MNVSAAAAKKENRVEGQKRLRALACVGDIASKRGLASGLAHFVHALHQGDAVARRWISVEKSTSLGATRVESRLTKVTRDGLLEAEYGYDLNGNRTTVNNDLGLSTSATYDAQDRLLSYGSTSYCDAQNGKAITYCLWRYDLTEQGWLKWTHARQLFRVQRVTENLVTGEKTVGNRFYVNSETPAALDPRAALRVSRAHWRCEDETHWTADAEMLEDRRRLAWSRHPNGILVVAVLRMIAIAILAVARKLSSMAYSLETPSWSQVAEHFLLVLCGSTLDLKAFDTL